jgi:hypothetical protein
MLNHVGEAHPPIADTESPLWGRRALKDSYISLTHGQTAHRLDNTLPDGNVKVPSIFDRPTCPLDLPAH